MPRSLGRRALALVFDLAAGRAGVAAVLGLHTAVLGHGGAGAHGGADLWRSDDDTLWHAAFADHVLDTDRPGRVDLLQVRHWRHHRVDLGHGGSVVVLARWPRHLAHGIARAGRRRTPCPARGRSLRAGGRDHRRAHAHRCRHAVCGLHHPDGAKQPVPEPGADHAGVFGAGHGHSDHSQLHHHQLTRRARFAGAGGAAHRLAHVRLLLRHHGRPHATGGTGGFCRCPHRA